jgi:hypothetical protein
VTKSEFEKLALEASRKSGPCSLCFLDGAEWGRAQGVAAERERTAQAFAALRDGLGVYEKMVLDGVVEKLASREAKDGS